MALEQSDYVFGHTDRERSRLIRQARALAPATKRFLRDSGIVSGMRVLDTGRGMVNVAMLSHHGGSNRLALVMSCRYRLFSKGAPSHEFPTRLRANAPPRPTE
jgi:hypothetical protein